MLLKNLLKNVKTIKIYGKTNIEIEHLYINSNEVKENGLFFAIDGYSNKGTTFIENCIEKGCTCIVVNYDYNLDSVLSKYENKISFVVVKNIRKFLSILSKIFYNYPDNSMTIIAITGTNGKTTTSHIIRDLLQYNRKKVGMIGTNGYYVNGKKIGEGLTTPDPIELYKTLDIMKNNKVEYVIMEASAHAIALHKIHSLAIDYAIFTNLTQDHLDFFKSIENYKKAKMSLFKRKNLKCIINVDDSTGMEIYKNLKSECISYGLTNPADVFAVDIYFDMNGSNFTLNMSDNLYLIKANFYGTYNLYNLLASFALMNYLGLTTNLEKNAQKIKNVPGRFNVYSYKNSLIVIDYAHTPDGLLNLLKGVKLLHMDNLITIFGCGGNRDKSKRKIMGEIADNFSDTIILTKDNSRSEKGIDIINDILEGIKNKEKVKIITDRGEAIREGIMLSNNSVVVIAGKGAEEYMEENNHLFKFSDTNEVLKAILLGRN